MGVAGLSIREIEQHMSEEAQAEEHRRRLGLPAGIDPLKAVDVAVVEKMVRAQVAARVQAAQTTTVFLATVVSLVTSAFGFVAALAWNSAIQTIISDNIKQDTFGKNLPNWIYPLGYAVIVTLIGVLVILFLNRIGRRLAKKSVIGGNGD